MQKLFKNYEDDIKNAGATLAVAPTNYIFASIKFNAEIAELIDQNIA